MKSNICCATDYRPGFINIDASNELNKVDRIITALIPLAVILKKTAKILLLPIT